MHSASWPYRLGIFVFCVKKKPQKPKPTPAPTPALDPNDPFNDDEKDRQQVEALAKKFENKYVSIPLSLIMVFNKSSVAYPPP